MIDKAHIDGMALIVNLDLKALDFSMDSLKKSNYNKDDAAAFEAIYKRFKSNVEDFLEIVVKNC